MSDDVRVFGSGAEVAQAAAAEIARSLQAAIELRGEASIVLSGGSTPRALYTALASAHLTTVAWARVDLYWGDERYVPHDHAASNYRMARESLLLSSPVRPGRVHPMPTNFADPARAAAAYDARIGQRERRPLFDVVLLGVGDDGHTASLFPGSAALTERSRRVVATDAPVDPRQRLTMTLPTLFDAAVVHVLVSGASKARAMERVWSGAPLDECPASALRATPTPVTWWTDRAAAASLGGR